MTTQSPLPPDIIGDLDRIAAATKGPFGSPSLRSLVRDHFALFAALRGQGASWKQITALLAERGIAGNDGRPVAATILRTTVSAVRPSVEVALRIGGHRREAPRHEAQCSEAQCSALQCIETCDANQSNESQRQDAHRSEAFRNKAQQQPVGPQHHARAKHRRRQRTPHGDDEIELQATASQRPPNRFRRLPAVLNETLLRRAERIQRLKEDTDD
jgi:hypothetical protein